MEEGKDRNAGGYTAGGRERSKCRWIHSWRKGKIKMQLDTQLEEGTDHNENKAGAEWRKGQIAMRTRPAQSGGRDRSKCSWIHSWRRTIMAAGLRERVQGKSGSEGLQ